ncbi:hypothetical protein HF576_02060 [Microbacterium sp. CFH 90308]|uniref:Uncharacterized protein n=1 Tax=Microbacterium salsuginis TaxID=2722803 RepID=A0ABX1K6U5_9MICO|nr:hypothetical protein [Microbacterium sp. CFH 90308]NLP82624.1 hypothetical protein [Microbacterium sp. CFH 90308]
MSASERAARQRAADAASKQARLIDLQALLAIPPVRNDGRGIDTLIPTQRAAARRDDA